MGYPFIPLEKFPSYWSLGISDLFLSPDVALYSWKALENKRKSCKYTRDTVILFGFPLKYLIKATE